MNSRNSHSGNNRIHRIGAGISLWVICLVLLITFMPGCDSDESPPPQAEALSNAQVLPRPTPPTPTDPGTASFIDVIATPTETDFPYSLTFGLSVESPHPISEIELRYRVTKVTRTAAITSIKPRFTPSTQVQTAWTWDTRKTDLPPGAEIEYQWVIANSAGARTTTDQARLIFNDTRHEWKELNRENVRLLWYRGHDDFGEELIESAVMALSKLEADTGARPESEVKLYIYGSYGDLRDALVYPQEWTGGLAFAEYGTVVIGISPDNLSWGKRTVAHELTHVVVHQIVEGPLGDLPTWLDEGLAMYIEGDLRKELQEKLDDAIAADNLHTVQSLGAAFPADYGSAALAYAQSRSLVAFLIDEYGSERMLSLLEVFQRGATVDEALLEAYGFNTKEFEDAWRASVGLS